MTVTKHHIKPMGKDKFIEGDRRYTKYLYGDMKIRFRKSEKGPWYVTVKKEGWQTLVQQVLMPPSIEYARMLAADVIPQWRLTKAEALVHVLGRIDKLNKKKPRANFIRLFELKPGWGIKRQKRTIRQCREDELVKKIKGIYYITEDGKAELIYQREVIGEYRRLRPDESGRKVVKKKKG